MTHPPGAWGLTTRLLVCYAATAGDTIINDCTLTYTNLMPKQAARPDAGQKSRGLLRKHRICTKK